MLSSTFGAWAWVPVIAAGMAFTYLGLFAIYIATLMRGDR